MTGVRRMGLLISLLEGCVVRHPKRGKSPLFQSKTIESLPESPTLALPGGAQQRFRLGAARDPLCGSKLNRVEPLGLRRTD